MGAEEELKLAYYGASIRELAKIATSGEMITEDAVIKCDGGHNQHVALLNAVHRFRPDGPSEDPYLYAAVVEMAVNHSR